MLYEVITFLNTMLFVEPEFVVSVIFLSAGRQYFNDKGRRTVQKLVFYPTFAPFAHP